MSTSVRDGISDDYYVNVKTLYWNEKALAPNPLNAQREAAPEVPSETRMATKADTNVALKNESVKSASKESETTIYLGTKHVIDLTSGPGQDQFEVLVEDYLKYLAYLEKWNGELPDVVSGDDALSIIVPNS